MGNWSCILELLLLFLLRLAFLLHLALLLHLGCLQLRCCWGEAEKLAQLVRAVGVRVACCPAALFHLLCLISCLSIALLAVRSVGLCPDSAFRPSSQANPCANLSAVVSWILSASSALPLQYMDSKAGWKVEPIGLTRPAMLQLPVHCVICFQCHVSERQVRPALCHGDVLACCSTKARCRYWMPPALN
jgi:hypothetical protein